VSEGNEGFKFLFVVIKELINSNVFSQLEADKTQVYCVDEYNIQQVDLLYKGVEYRVEIKNWHDDTMGIVTDSVTGEELHCADPIVDEIIDYVLNEVPAK
jgi:hypothetical protein